MVKSPAFTFFPALIVSLANRFADRLTAKNQKTPQLFELKIQRNRKIQKIFCRPKKANVEKPCMMKSINASVITSFCGGISVGQREESRRSNPIPLRSLWFWLLGKGDCRTVRGMVQENSQLLTGNNEESRVFSRSLQELA